MSPSIPYPAHVEFQGDLGITNWRPLVQWILAIPQLLIASALRSLREVLLLISLFTVLFTEQIPQPIFEMIVMTYRYEWRTLSYALFLHEDYPPFDFQPSIEDNGADPHSTLRIAVPEHLARWKPLYKWFLAIPHYVVLFVLGIGVAFGVLAALVIILFTGRYPEGIRNFVVGTYRYALRVESYIGFLTDIYPPFSLEAERNHGLPA